MKTINTKRRNGGFSLAEIAFAALLVGLVTVLILGAISLFSTGATQGLMDLEAVSKAQVLLHHLTADVNDSFLLSTDSEKLARFDFEKDARLVAIVLDPEASDAESYPNFPYADLEGPTVQRFEATRVIYEVSTVEGAVPGIEIRRTSESGTLTRTERGIQPDGTATFDHSFHGRGRSEKLLAEGPGRLDIVALGLAPLAADEEPLAADASVLPMRHAVVVGAQDVIGIGIRLELGADAQKNLTIVTKLWMEARTLELRNEIAFSDRDSRLYY